MSFIIFVWKYYFHEKIFTDLKLLEPSSLVEKFFFTFISVSELRKKAMMTFSKRFFVKKFWKYILKNLLSTCSCSNSTSSFTFFKAFAHHKRLMNKQKAWLSGNETSSQRNLISIEWFKYFKYFQAPKETYVNRVI